MTLQEMIDRNNAILERRRAFAKYAEDKKSPVLVHSTNQPTDLKVNNLGDLTPRFDALARIIQGAVHESMSQLREEMSNLREETHANLEHLASAIAESRPTDYDDAKVIAALNGVKDAVGKIKTEVKVPEIKIPAPVIREVEVIKDIKIPKPEVQIIKVPVEVKADPPVEASKEKPISTEYIRDQWGNPLRIMEHYANHTCVTEMKRDQWGNVEEIREYDE